MTQAAPWCYCENGQGADWDFCLPEAPLGASRNLHGEISSRGVSNACERPVRLLDCGCNFWMPRSYPILLDPLWALARLLQISPTIACERHCIEASRFWLRRASDGAKLQVVWSLVMRVWWSQSAEFDSSQIAWAEVPEMLAVDCPGPSCEMTCGALPCFHIPDMRGKRHSC